MNRISFGIIWGLAGLTLGGVVACRKEESTRAKSVIAGREPLVPVIVEVRTDGLAYLGGADRPFTGDAITPHTDTPWLVKLKEPYTEGKRDGNKLELFKDGTVKTLRRYNQGKPEYAASYHKNGQLKFELNLNSADKGEGPYQRWYEDGTLESTAGLDAEEKWHGEFKEWTKTGELKTHHIFRNGLLEKIIFETTESAAARKAAGVELEKPTAPSAALPAAGH